MHQSGHSRAHSMQTVQFSSSRPMTPRLRGGSSPASSSRPTGTERANPGPADSRGTGSGAADSRGTDSGAADPGLPVGPELPADSGLPDGPKLPGGPGLR